MKNAGPRALLAAQLLAHRRELLTRWAMRRYPRSPITEELVEETAMWFSVQMMMSGQRTLVAAHDCEE